MDQILEEARICQEKLEELKMAAVQVRSSRSYSSWEDKKIHFSPLVGPASWWHPATAGSLATSGAVSRQAARSSQRKRRPPTVAQVILITMFIIFIIRGRYQRNGCLGLHFHPLFFYLSWAPSFLGFHLVEPAACLWYDVILENFSFLKRDWDSLKSSREKSCLWDRLFALHLLICYCLERARQSVVFQF